jgi:hypothetical protein
MVDGGAQARRGIRSPVAGLVGYFSFVSLDNGKVGLLVRWLDSLVKKEVVHPHYHCSPIRPHQ